MLEIKFTEQQLESAIKNYTQERGQLKVFSKYKQPPNIHWDDEKYQGSAYATYAWAYIFSRSSSEHPSPMIPKC